MTRTALTPLLGLLVLSVALSACGGGLASLDKTVGLWRGGYRTDAVRQAADEYRKFRDANELTEAQVEGWADALAERIDEEPVVARGERLGGLPGARAAEGPGTLDRGIGADLLSSEASRVARALGVIGGLTLGQHAAAVIAVIYDHRVIRADGDVLSDLDPAERTVTIKHLALDTLAALK